MNPSISDVSKIFASEDQQSKLRDSVYIADNRYEIVAYR